MSDDVVRVINEYDDSQHQLVLSSDALAWVAVCGAFQATIEIFGAPWDADVRFVIYVPLVAWPSGSYSLLWRGIRIRGLDLAGAPHRIPSGDSIKTPHRQGYADAKYVVLEVNLVEERIYSWESALRWFADWCSLSGRPEWRDPPF